MMANGGDCRYSPVMSPLNLGTLQSWIDQGRIDPSKPITLKELVESRCLHGIKDGVKILAKVNRTNCSLPICPSSKVMEVS